MGYFPGNALSLGLAAVSPDSARRLLAFMPELEHRVRAMQVDPETALQELAEELRRRTEE